MSQNPDHSDEIVEDEGEGQEHEMIVSERPHRHGKNLFLRSTAVLPALLTIMNGICGFASIHFATKNAFGAADSINLAIAAWLIFAAMIFDMLDGRVARMTRLTSDFGAQLDSLCDAISFGAAPAMLMLRTVATAMPEDFGQMNVLFERIVWCIGAVYLACAVLRLARFNVENAPDESAHMVFKGLPSPAAAATVASLVLLFVHVMPNTSGGAAALWSPSTLLPLATKYATTHEVVYIIGLTFSILLPIVTLLAAIMMVSRSTYPHLVNQYLRGKKSFAYLVRLIIILVALILEFVLTAAVMIMIYFLSGIIKLRRPDKSPRQPAIITPVPDHPKLTMETKSQENSADNKGRQK